MKGLLSIFEWLSHSSKLHEVSLSNSLSCDECYSFLFISFLTFYFQSAGETTYNLDTAGGLRLEVQKYYELIDALRYMHTLLET